MPFLPHFRLAGNIKQKVSLNCYIAIAIKQDIHEISMIGIAVNRRIKLSFHIFIILRKQISDDIHAKGVFCPGGEEVKQYVGS